MTPDAGSVLPVITSNVKLTHKHLRKSVLTAASNDPKVPDRLIDLLAGHSVGIKEHYVVKKNVQLACEAIERHYFCGRQ